MPRVNNKTNRIRLNNFDPYPIYTNKLSNQKKCNDCGDNLDLIFKVYNGKKFCNECYLSHREICTLCGKEEKDRSILFSARIEDESSKIIMMCEQCSSKLQVCEHDGCETFFKKNNDHKCDQCDGQYCKNHKFGHSCKRGEPTHLFRNPSNDRFNGTPELAKEIKIPWLVGIELEAVNGDPNILHSKLDNKIGMNHDGSLQGRQPIEMQIPPSSNDKLERFIKHITRVSRNSGYRVNKTCGMHIHIDASDIIRDNTFIFRLLSTYYAIEPVIFAMLPKSRRDNKYALPLRNWIGEAKMLEMTRKPIPNIESLQMIWYKSREIAQTIASKGNRYDSSRYHGFNLHALFTRGTIEMRYHHGTLNKTKITNWINFHLMIFDWVRTKYDQNVIDAIFFCENPSNKFRLMCRHFKFPKIIRRYVMRNIKKFSDNDNEDQD